jgi:biotin transport system substrate-specific component
MLGCAAGTAVCYLLGTVWFMRAGGSMSPGAAITCCVLPFLIPDVCKIVLACLISRRITPLFGTASSQK